MTLTIEQGFLIKDCFYNNLDVHFKVDGNDYNLFARHLAVSGTLQVNCEMDFDIEAVHTPPGGDLLALIMAGGDSGFCFPLAKSDTGFPADEDEDIDPEALRWPRGSAA